MPIEDLTFIISLQFRKIFAHVRCLINRELVGRENGSGLMPYADSLISYVYLTLFTCLLAEKMAVVYLIQVMQRK